MIQEIIIAVVNFIVGFISLILTPIDNLILTFLPDLSNAFTAIGNFLVLISSYVGWAVSLSGLSSATLSLIVAYYTFKLTAPISFYLIKLAVAWYNKLKF